MIVSRQAQIDSSELNAENLIDRILLSRGIASKKELDYSLANLQPFTELKDIDKACQLLAEAIEQQQKILIVGDFDADGATSSALGILVLKAFGAKHIDYLVPNRFDYGYGLSPELVELAKTQQPDLIVTVDNGISSIQGVHKAKEYGIKVVITDHHLAGDELPQADAIVNPNQPDDKFASKNLAGVGVMFYLLLALRSYLRDKNWFEQEKITEPNLSHYLDLVALGTVADLVALDYNNRILVHHGLRLMRAAKARPGILQLLNLTKKNLAKVKSTDLGFAVGPRINAAGRLDDMSLGIECLLASDEKQAREYAQILHQLNSDRQQVEQEMQDEAMAILAEQSFENFDANSLCLYQAHWHQGVVGLLASRIKEKVNRPCIVFANEDEKNLKGSARSVKELHIRDALALLDSQQPGLITKFGGHAMAAGLSIKSEDFERFCQYFESVVTQLLQGDAIGNEIETDGSLSPEQLQLATIEQLNVLAPFGQGFPEPIFSGEFEVLTQRIVGENHLKLALKPPQDLNADDSEAVLQAIAFRVEVAQWQQKARKIRAVYQLDVNDYYQQPQLQLIIQYLERLD